MQRQPMIRGCLAALLLSIPVVLPVAAQETPSVPPGTEIVVRTLEPMASATATTGQKFAVEVAADVVVDGAVRVPAGTRGQGTVIFARKKGTSGRPGALDLRVDAIDAPGGAIRLRSAETNRGTDRRRSGTAAGIAFGLIGAALVQGEDIDVPAGTELHAVVAPPRPVAPPATAAAAATDLPPAAETPAPAAPAAAAVPDAATSGGTPSDTTTTRNPR